MAHFSGNESYPPLGKIMHAEDISLFSLIFCLALLLVPMGIGLFFKLQITKSIFISVGRMTAQLFFAGLYLKTLFQINNPILNLFWLIIMVAVASFSVIKNSDINLKPFILPVFSVLTVTNLLIVLYFNYFVVNLQNLFDARYLVVIGGMLLGNSMRGNIIGISSFYKSIKRNEKRYFYHLANGATQYEALGPYLREALNSSIRPTIATMMTIGIVSLPGMMTGQMLGGSSPMVAIKYQIAIMIAIFTSMTSSITLILLITNRSCFNGCGVMKKSVFK
jgi:putative ABC transport system permease protein